MADQAEDTLSQARQGANWLVGLSGAALGGALAKLDWILTFPRFGKIFFLGATVFFLLSILFGVFYSFQLYALKQRKEKLAEAGSGWSPDPTAVATARTNLDNAAVKVERFHIWTMGTFALAGLMTTVSLGFVLFVSPKPLAPPVAAVPNHYSVTTVQVVLPKGQMHSHTLLLDEQTGELWLMQCAPGKTVEFRQIHRFDFNGHEVPAPVAPSIPKPLKN
ncbi:MAG TPA: hypothetical protein VHX37_04605 [Acidobacteriaceae bacterium]|jgi:hypothetical protein|nr:hypothetical protein [Acidobacteriaceae bacterium]